MALARKRGRGRALTVKVARKTNPGA